MDYLEDLHKPNPKNRVHLASFQYATDTFLVSRLANTIEDDAGVFSAASAPVEYDVRFVGVDVLQDVASVGDDQARPSMCCPVRLFGEQRVHHIPHQCQGLQVHAEVGPVHHGESRTGDQELKKLGALDLAPGKAGIDIALQKPVHPKVPRQLTNLLGPFRGIGDDVIEDLPQLDPGDGGGALLRDADAQPGPLGDIQFGDVFSVENYLPFGYSLFYYGYLMVVITNVVLPHPLGPSRA